MHALICKKDDYLIDKLIMLITVEHLYSGHQLVLTKGVCHREVFAINKCIYLKVFNILIYEIK